ncbi:histone-like nucleoid-structuring protein Lsr2 [Microbacterium lacticum]
MARKIVHQLVDDLDGTVLEVGSGETILFSLDGTAYEIDLTDENAVALRDALAPFIAAARSVSARAGGRSGSGSSGGSGGSGGARRQKRSGQRDYAPVREWAAQNGYTVSQRGRIPAPVLEAYDAAH